MRETVVVDEHTETLFYLRLKDGTQLRFKAKDLLKHIPITKKQTLATDTAGGSDEWHSSKGSFTIPVDENGEILCKGVMEFGIGTHKHKGKRKIGFGVVVPKGDNVEYGWNNYKKHRVTGHLYIKEFMGQQVMEGNAIPLDSISDEELENYINKAS